MKLKTGNPRVRGPRKKARDAGSGSRRPGAEPSTFAWFEPLADVAPVIVEKEIVIDREVEKRVVVSKEVIVEKPVTVEKEVFVEKQVFVDRQVIVEKPVIVEKEVFVDRPVLVEKEVFVEKQVFVEKAAGKADDKASVAKKQRTGPKQKAIIIGRGPSLAAKIARLAPKPSPVFAGAAAMLIALAGVALISPSSDRATAARSDAPFTSQQDGATAIAAIGITKKSQDEKTGGESRDPFAAKSYKAPVAKTDAATGKKPGVTGQSKTAKTPAAATPSLFAAELTTYSSYTPWAKSTKRSGTWIDFGGKPTVKVISVGKNSVDLFVVTDVEVVTDKSKNFKYDNPLRQIHLAKDGVVRFADYRDIEGDDVTYTIRYRGSEQFKPSAKK